MPRYRLNELEVALVKRNPLLTQKLRPPLSESDICAILKRAKMVGAIEPIIALYTWHNGTIWDDVLMKSKSGFFPGEVYQFVDLEKAIGHRRSYAECVCSYFPKLANLAERYLPVFWDGSAKWVGLDANSSACPVVMIRYFVREASVVGGRYEPEIREKEPPREAYRSFEDFIADAIRANRESSPLACFKTK